MVSKKSKSKRIKTLVTPILSKLWLATTKHNRQVKYSKVHAIAKDMMGDNFDADNSVSDIEFENGHLVNGQHRLKAIIRNKKPVYLYITRR